MLLKAMGVDITQIEDQAKQFVTAIIEALQRIEVKQDKIIHALENEGRILPEGIQHGRSDKDASGTSAS